MDKYIKHFCDELGIGRKSHKKLEDHGILTLADLMKVPERIQKRELNGIREDVKEKLMFAAEWKLSHPDADFVEDFSEDYYEEWYNAKMRGRIAEKYIKRELGQPYRAENVDLYTDIDADPVLLDAVVSESKSIIMQSSKLQEACGKFDYYSFLDKAIRHFHAVVGQESGVPEKQFIVAGRTQAGKTSVKGVIQSLCGLLNIPLVILTKGVDESIDLHAKLVVLAEGTQVQEKHVVVASSKHDGLYYRIKDIRVKEALEGGTHGGSLVIADTKTQVLNKACKAIKAYREQIPGGNFVLAVDEADAMFRTRDRHQVFEQALQQLLDLDPAMTVMISATPVPFLMELVDRTGNAEDDIELFNLEPQENYVGIEDIQPLEIDGKRVYLEQNELAGRTEYTSDGVTICCANEKNMALYDDALSDRTNRKGILVLDCSCPRVYALNNIRDKADAVQEHYRKQEKDIIVVTYSGRGLAMKVPGGDWDYGYRQLDTIDSTSQNCKKRRKKMKKKPGMYRHDSWKLIGRLLEYIDCECGLDVPVFVFGYSKMRRGVSFRSTNRVPTHMVMALGRGHNISTIVQTLGRVTFNGRNVLKENGFDFVTVLTTSSDLTLCIKTQNYINQVSRRVQVGDTFSAAVTGANQQIPDSANFLRHTFRELGRIKGQRRQFEEEVDVEEVPAELSPDEVETREIYWNDAEAQKVLRALARLRKGSELLNPGDVVDDLEEADDYYELSRTRERELLRKFYDKSLISKNEDGNGRTRGSGQYKIPTVDRLVRFMNPAEGLLPDDDEQSDVGEEDCGDDFRPQMQNLVSNVSELSAVSASGIESGSKDSPIDLLDSDSECNGSLSSVPLVVAAKLVTPQKLGDSKMDHAESFVGKRVAKIFSEVHFGSVVHYCGDSEYWRIVYDDEDEEEFDEDDLNEALLLYERERSNDGAKSTGRELLTNIEHIPMVRPSNTSMQKRCISQPERKRRVYFCAGGDTPSKIAKQFDVDVHRIIQDNKRRENYEDIEEHVEFETNSPIVLPWKAARRCEQKHGTGIN